MRRGNLAHVLDTVRMRARYGVITGRQAHRDGQVSRPDIDAIDTGDRGDCLDVLDANCRLDHDDAAHALAHDNGITTE